MGARMIKALKETLKNLDEKIKKIMINGLYFSLIISIIGTRNTYLLHIS